MNIVSQYEIELMRQMPVYAIHPVVDFGERHAPVFGIRAAEVRLCLLAQMDPPPPVFDCSMCGRGFKSKTELYRHIGRDCPGPRYVD